MKWIHFLTPKERLMSKVVVDKNGCWNFNGYKNQKGYGKFSVNDKVMMAHRASFLIHGGIIPGGFTIDHTCKNRGCVNPAHLEAVPHRVNLLRGNTVTAINHNKTHCTKGHAFNAANTIIDKTGRRRCKICNLTWRKSKYQKLKS